jgi:molybdenum cofactor guanylyltransferase
MIMWSAAILAGGAARRFGGCDKGALMIDGRSIRERQIMELSRLTSDILIVGARPTPVPRARIVSDLVPGHGPLGGLHTALIESTGDRTIVVACDMPYITAPLLRHLLALTRDADIVVPRTDGGYHPLCAAYTRACIEPVAQRLADGRLKMTDLFADVRVREVTAEELEPFGDCRRLLSNVNTPDEYRGLEALQGHQP